MPDAHSRQECSSPVNRQCWLPLALIGLTLLSTLPSAHGFIAELYSLEKVMKISDVIVEGEIESVDKVKRTAVARISKGVKGKCAFTKIKMNIGVGQSYFPSVLMEKLKPGQPMALFYDLDGRKIASLCHSGDIWFQFFAQQDKVPDKTWWRFTHVEVHMNRTFAGSTAELISLVREVQAGKRRPPKPNPGLRTLSRKDLLGDGAGTVATVAKSTDRPERSPVRVVKVPVSPERIDGLEAEEEWLAEEWGNPGVPRIVDTRNGRGKLLTVGYAPGEKDKIAISQLLEQDFSKGTRLLFEARNDSDKPITIAWGISTMPGWKYFESPAISLPPKRWDYDVEVGLTAKSFKSEETQWKYTTEVKNSKEVAKVTLLVYGAPDSGTLSIDRLRLDRGDIFVRSIPLPHAGKEARSVSWADYDGDGDLDAFICSSRGNRLYRNSGGDLADVTADAGLQGGSRCASWADYDRDGDLDLFLSTPALWTNEKGVFRDSSQLLPKLEGRNTEGAGWLDANGDGRPDLLMSNGEFGTRLFLNKGEGPNWFEDASKDWGLGKGGLGAGNGDFLTITDYDADGFADFLYNLGRGILAHNEDGEAFVLEEDAGVRYQTSNSHKIGTAFGDYDNDGDLDLFVPQNGASLLFRNNNDYTFTNVTKDAGALAGAPGRARAAAWGDVDGDGDLDLLVGFARTPARLYANGGDGKFTDATASSGLHNFACTTGATGMAFADWDRDGDLDLLVTGEDTSSGVLINEGPRTSETREPLLVSLPPQESPGAVIRVNDDKQGLTGLRVVGLVQNFSSQAPLQTLFSVKKGEYSVSVIFTDGESIEKTVDVKEGGFVWDIPPRKAGGEEE